MSRFHFVSRVFSTLAFVGLAVCGRAQCKFEVNETDVITGQHTMRTASVRINDGVKVKDGVSVGFLDMKLCKGPQGATLELHVHTKNPQNRMLMFRVPNDSIALKFTDGTILSLPCLELPKQYMNSFNGKSMVSFVYALTPELMAKFRTGLGVQVLRISTSSQKWDFLEFKRDPGKVFRDCWPIE